MTFSPVVAAKFSGCFGAITIRFGLALATKSERSAVTSAIFCASVRSSGELIVEVSMTMVSSVWPSPLPAFSVTSRPETFADLMIGLVPVIVFRAPGESEKASSRSVQEAPLSSLTSSAWIAVLTA